MPQDRNDYPKYQAMVPKGAIPANVAIYVVDYTTGKFTYISESITSLIGYSPELYYDKGMDFLYSKMHPEDYRRVLKQQVESFKRFQSDSVRVSPLKIVNYEFRIQNNLDHWVTVVNTGVILSFSEERYPQNSMGFIKKTQREFDNRSEENCIQLIGSLYDLNIPSGIARLLRQKRLVFDESSLTPISSSLFERSPDIIQQLNISSREKEVLQFIADGFSTKEIAGHLFLSEETVISHRKNLLKKFKVRNTAELIKKASKVFWLE